MEDRRRSSEIERQPVGLSSLEAEGRPLTQQQKLFPQHKLKVEKIKSVRQEDVVSCCKIQ